MGWGGHDSHLGFPYVHVVCTPCFSRIFILQPMYMGFRLPDRKSHLGFPYLHTGFSSTYSFLETTLTYYNLLGCKSHPWLPISCQTISGNATTLVPQCNYSNVKSFTKTMYLSIFKFKKTTFPNSKSSSQLLQEQIPNSKFQMQTISIVDFLLLSSTAIPGLKHTDRDPSHHHCSYGKLASTTYFVYGMRIASQAHKHFLA